MKIRLLILCTVLLAGVSGCGILPHISHQPVIQNPFPQLSRVAVAPFFNQSDEKTVDGRQFAMAYFNELQATPGFEVVPVNVVEEAMIRHQIALNDPLQARRLAQILGVDVVVVGTVTDFTPYYPPQCGLRVEWWAANPSFHPIPAGYGLPWGTPEEEHIPASLVYEAELALAKEQMATQTPDCIPYELPPAAAPSEPELLPTPNEEGAADPQREATDATKATKPESVKPTSHNPAFVAGDATGMIGPVPGIPQGWPDPRGFAPDGPSCVRPPCIPSDKPVIEHTRIYQSTDADFIASLESYVYFREDARMGGWQSYLERTNDFISFCCYRHISEMLSARGGAAESRVVWRWSDRR